MESCMKNCGVLMRVVSVLALLQLSSAAQHTVGDSSGWTFQVNYTRWAAKQAFHVGDILLFPYAQGMHNVLEVNKAGYDSCSIANAISTYATANASVTLSKAGEQWFVCGIGKHCDAGMKLHVNVLASPPASSASSRFPVAEIGSVAMAGMMLLAY